MGIILEEKRTKTDEAELRPTDLRDRARHLAHVFLPHEGLAALYDSSVGKDKRIFVVAGDHETGRFACATWLGWKFTGGKHIALFSDRVLQRYSLGELAGSPLLEKDSAYIIEDPFKAGLTLDSIVDVQGQTLNDRLNRENSWLIFVTGPLTPSRGQNHIEFFEIERGSPDPAFLGDVFSKHLEDFKRNGRMLRTDVEKIARDWLPRHVQNSNLDTAPKVYRFVHALLGAGPSPESKEEIVEWLARVAEDASESRPRQAWFLGLRPNAQFLALLVGAFEGLGRDQVEEIYCDQVQSLRKQDRELFEDPRRQGFEELYQEIRVDISGKSLRFVSPSFRREVIRQIGFRHHLLREVLNSVKGRMTLLDEHHWMERELLGLTVARVEIHHPNTLKSTLGSLAASDDVAVASLPGFILRGVCLLDDPRFDFVGNLLEEWVSPKEGSLLQGTNGFLPRRDSLLWAAAEATRRTYVDLVARGEDLAAQGQESIDGDYKDRLVAMLERLEEILSRFAASKRIYEKSRHQTWAEEEFLSILSSVVIAMFRSQPDRIVNVLLRWLKKTSKPRTSEPPAQPESGQKPAAADDPAKPDSAPVSSGEKAASGAEVPPPEPVQSAAAAERSAEGSGSGENPQTKPASSESTPPAPEAQKAKTAPPPPVKAVDDSGSDNAKSELFASASWVTRRLFESHRDPMYLSPRRRKCLLKLVGPVLESNRENVDGILEILRGWVLDRQELPGSSAERSPAAILEALLQACNEMSEAQRRGLRRGLMTLWLPSLEASVRFIAQVVITRARLLEGMPTDLRGGSWGGLFVDASAEGRVEETSFRAIQELFELLRPHCDLWVAELGNRTELCRPGWIFDPNTLPSRPYRVRQLVPWVEHLAIEEKSPAIFYTVVVWKILADATDIKAATEIPVLVCDGSELSTAADVIQIFGLLGFPPEWLFSREDVFESLLWSVEKHLSPLVSRRLATRSSEEWWQLLMAQDRFSTACVEITDRKARAERILREVIEELPATTDSQATLDKPFVFDRLPEDPLRLGLGIVLWFAAEDLARIVRFLRERLHKKVEPARAVANSAAIMLVRMHYERMLPVLGGEEKSFSPPPLNLCDSLLCFGSAFAFGRSRLGIRAFLFALRHWLTDSAWAAELLRDARQTGPYPKEFQSAKSKLLSVTTSLPSWMWGQVLDALDDWKKPLKVFGEKDTPAAVHALALRLRYDLVLRCRFDPEEGKTHPIPMEPFCLVVSSCDPADPITSELVRSVVWALYEQWEMHSTPDHPRYLFLEAGRRVPLAVSQEKAMRDAFNVDAPVVAALAPALDPLDPGAVKLVVIISNRHLVDFEELPEWLTQSKKLLSFWVPPVEQPDSTSPDGWERLESNHSNEAKKFALLVRKIQTQLSSNS